MSDFLFWVWIVGMVLMALGGPLLAGLGAFEDEDHAIWWIVAAPIWPFGLALGIAGTVVSLPFVLMFLLGKALSKKNSQPAPSHTGEG